MISDSADAADLSEMSYPTAGIILIGNELLSGKIKDENATFLAERLRELGVVLERVLVIPDRAALIGEEVRDMSERYDYVFTSGGVGPTHDDVTLEGVAEAFAVDLYVEPKLSDILNTYFADRITEAHLRMAHIPKGSTLIWPPKSPWPVYSYRNVFIFPGVPSILKSKFNSIAERFRAATIHLRSVYLSIQEGEIAHHLSHLERDLNVMVGSYPRTEKDVDYQVRVTIESREADHVNLAVDQLLASLNSDALVRLDPSVSSTESEAQEEKRSSTVDETSDQAPDEPRSTSSSTRSST
jgi:molybdenum cofactor synthesis domain-containing protein